MPVTINGTNGVITPEVVLDNNTADGGQVVLSSSGFSNWNLDNFSGRLRAYYGSTEYLTLTNAGNLGVGTSSPSHRLHVNGNAYVPLTNSYFCFNSDFGMGTPDQDMLQIFAGAGNGIRFGQRVSGTFTERARIDSSGNFLVGTTSQVSNARASFVTTSSGAWAVAARGQDRGYLFQNVGSSGIAMYFTTNNDSQVAGQVTVNNTSTTYATSSDYRLKENIQPMIGALEKVEALKPCTYNWKFDGTAGQGFIAHELAEVCPQAVVGEKDAVDADGKPVYQGIDTSFLVATLTTAIQELHAQHIELKAIVDQQATEIANLKGQA